MVTSSIDSLRLLMERGPDSTKVGVFNYQNTGYGLLRLIIAYADGYGKLSPDVDIKSLSAGTAMFYKNAVKKYLLIPAGVDSAECMINEPYPAFQYPFPYNNEPGELTGDPDLTAFAGGFGWYMSAHEVGKVLNAVFVKKEILSSGTLQELSALEYPIRVRHGKYGTFFGNGGDWGHPIKPNGWRGIHTYFHCLPENIVVVVFMNSGESSPARRMMKAYVRSFE
jgi:hypothetical protein